MAREKSETVVLVSPDGKDKREVANATTETELRFRGYLPEDQAKLKAPKAPAQTPPVTVGSNPS